MKIKTSLSFILSLSILNLIACSTIPPKPTPDPGETVAEFPRMSVGDSWVVSDYHGTFGTATYTYEVTSVEADGSFNMKKENDKDNKAKFKYFDSAATGVPMIMGSQFDPEALQFPLFVGKSWKTEAGTKSMDGVFTTYRSEYFVEEYTKVGTALGVYDAFRIKQKLRSMDTDWRGINNQWYAPAAKAIVKSKPSHKRGIKLVEVNLIE